MLEGRSVMYGNIWVYFISLRIDSDCFNSNMHMRISLY